MSEEYIVICDIAKSDSISLDGTYCDDMTGWKITAQICDDCCILLELGTANVDGGSDDEIIVNSTSAEESNFTIMVAKDVTTCYPDIVYLKVQVETTNVVGGETERFSLATSQIFFTQLGSDE